MRIPKPFRAVPRLLAVLALVAGTVAFTAPSAAAGQVAAVAVSAAQEPATNSLAALNGCLVEQKQGDVLIMLDESGSIKGTDPGAARVSAAKALVSSLAARISDPSSEIAGAKLSVTVASFSDSVYQDGSVTAADAARWQNLDQAGLGKITADIDSYRSRNGGMETDYWSALRWVIDAENAHSKASTSNGCHLVFWFTDGEYLIQPRTNDPGWHGATTKPTPWRNTPVSPDTTKAQAAQIQAEGTTDICRPGGLADQIRRADLTLAAVGLGSNEADFALMKRIAINPKGDCGALPGTGVFDRADVTSLLLLVEGLGSSATQLPVDTKPVCQLSPCSSTHDFTLDSSLRRVHIVGVPSVAGLQVQVRSPDGQSATIQPVSAGGPSAAGKPSDTTVSGITLHYQWVSDRQLTIDMVRPDNTTNWSGKWSVTFIDTSGNNPKAVAATRVSLSADLALVANPAPTQAQAGEKFTAALALSSLNGEAAVLGSPPPTMIGTVILTPSASGSKPVQLATGRVEDLIKSGIAWSTPADFPLGPAKLQLTLAVTTVTGIKLDPVLRQYTITVKPAKGMPSVVGTALDFGNIEGTGTGTSTLSVAGPGCVWVTGGNVVTHPNGVDAVTIGGQAADAAHCLTLADGETKDLTVTATPAAQGNGSLSGDVMVHLAPQGHPDRAAQQAVPYTMNLRRTAETTVVVGVFAAALVVGIGLPIAVLWLTRRIAARYPADVELVAARIPVLVSARGLTVSGGGSPQLPQQWSAVPPPTDGRRTLLVEGVRWRARTGPIWSAQPGFSEADRPGTGGARPFHSAKTFTARLPLGVQGSWALLFRSLEDLGGRGEQIAGELLLITNPRSTEQVRRTLLGEALGQGPGLVTDLRESVRSAAGQPPVGGSAGGPGEAGTGPISQPAGWQQGAGPSGPSGELPTGPTQVPGWGNAAPRPPAPDQSGRPGQQPGWGSAGGTSNPGWPGQFQSQPHSQTEPPGRSWGQNPG